MSSTRLSVTANVLEVVVQSQHADPDISVAAPTPKPKKKDTAQPKNDVTNGVANLNIQEPVKVKSKNIDVLAEYKNLQHKNAANFVVIGKLVS